MKYIIQEKFTGYNDIYIEAESKNEAIRFLLEGRKNRSKSGEELAYTGLRFVGLIEHAEDIQTGKKGRPTHRYKITQLGIQTLSNLDLRLK